MLERNLELRNHTDLSENVNCPEFQLVMWGSTSCKEKPKTL